MRCVSAAFSLLRLPKTANQSPSLDIAGMRCTRLNRCALELCQKFAPDSNERFLAKRNGVGVIVGFLVEVVVIVRVEVFECDLVIVFDEVGVLVRVLV